MTRLVDVYLKDIQAHVIFQHKSGNKVDIGYKDFTPVYGAHTADDEHTNSEDQLKQFKHLSQADIPLDSGTAGTLSLKYACTLENLSFSSQRKESSHSQKEVSWATPKLIKHFPIDLTDTKHFREW